MDEDLGGRRDALDPDGFDRRLDQFLEWLRVNHYAEDSVTTREKCVSRFAAWCAERGITRPADVTKPVLELYQAHLFHARRQKDGLPLSLSFQMEHLCSVRVFFKWLARQNHLLYNPASDLVLPRVVKRLPKHVLTEEEAERVINLPDVASTMGLRDRAILETLYSTGMRRMELVGLKMYDLDWDRGTVFIREGKGKKQRVVPIGDRALGWIEKYLSDTRPQLVVPPDEGHVFLTRFGGPFTADAVSGLVRHFVELAEIPKTGAAHLLRHTCATVMLEHGADIRFIQAMLGHAKLETTQVYTQVSIRKLKEVHTAAHPARLKKPRASRKADGAAPAAAPPDAAPPPPPAP